MQRAGQTTHGARPNRKGAELILTNQFLHVPARCVQPSGRSLEPRSDAWPRGMTVPPEQSGGQNSAYRSGCHILLVFPLFALANFRIVTAVSRSEPTGQPDFRSLARDLFCLLAHFVRMTASWVLTASQ